MTLEFMPKASFELQEAADLGFTIPIVYITQLAAAAGALRR